MNNEVRKTLELDKKEKEYELASLKKWGGVVFRQYFERLAGF